MKSRLIALLLPFAAGLAGCGVKSATDNAPAAATPIAVKLVQPKRGDITRSITLPGNVTANQQVALYAKVGGYLKSISVDKGDTVKEGALLAEIEVPELLADQAKYKAEVEVADIEFKRISEAQQKAPDLVVRQSTDTARAKLEVARANLNRAETLLQFCRITAPFPGVVTARSVDPGAFIPAATSGSAAQTRPLLNIADFSRVRVQVSVPEPETPLIRNGVSAKVTIDELPGVPFEGTVTRYSHALDESSKTMLAEIDLPNPEGRLLPGMYASVKLGVETHPDTLLIPTDALVVEKVGSAVFTVTAGKAVRVPVKTGFNDGVSVEILDGVKPGDSLILVGKRTLTAGQAVNVTP
jgi:membrane fusion protein (multidrug efflux system)